MKHFARGLWVMAVGIALAFVTFGLFSAMEQGPPGPASFQVEPAKTSVISDALLVGVIGTVTFGLAAYIVVAVGVRLRRWTRDLAWMNRYFSLLAAAVVGTLRKLVPMPHFTTSRPGAG
jgi:hypothetical protein